MSFKLLKGELSPANCARKIAGPLIVFTVLGFPVDYTSGLLQCVDGFLWQSTAYIRRKIQQKVRISRATIRIIGRNRFRALRRESRTPEPTMHRRHRFVRRSGWHPGFHRHVIGFVLELHISIMAFSRRQRVFTVGSRRSASFSARIFVPDYACSDSKPDSSPQFRADCTS